MSKHKPHFLLTNDDGIHSPGILYLWEAVREFADITIIAPDREKSGSGASATIESLQITPVSDFGSTQAYKVSGTPVDCIKVGLSILLEKPPNMILSGINHGTNAGRTILFSGTVGGVIEGVLRNVPGIAFSYWRYDTSAFAYIKKYILPIVKYLSSCEIPSGSFYNVNFPGHQEHLIKGFKVVPHGHSKWIEKPVKEYHPEGHIIYSMNGEWADHCEPEGTDVHYLKQGYITASPIHVAQLTDFSMLSNHKEDFEQSFDNHFPT
jgi:5'-nucleotidase